MAKKPNPRPHIKGKPKAPKPAPAEPSSGMDRPTEEQMMAAVDLIGRTGSKSFGLRYQDDELPVIWTALAEYSLPKGSAYKVAAGLTPVEAVFALCAEVMDGGRCTHCHRVTGFTPDFEEQIEIGVMHVDGDEETIPVCWYQYDPELKTYRRGCEASAD
jgi:hypothetical protein